MIGGGWGGGKTGKSTPPTFGTATLFCFYRTAFLLGTLTRWDLTIPTAITSSYPLGCLQRSLRLTMNYPYDVSDSYTQKPHISYYMATPPPAQVDNAVVSSVRPQLANLGY